MKEEEEVNISNIIACIVLFHIVHPCLILLFYFLNDQDTNKSIKLGIFTTVCIFIIGCLFMIFGFAIEYVVTTSSAITMEIFLIILAQTGKKSSQKIMSKEVDKENKDNVLTAVHALYVEDPTPSDANPLICCAKTGRIMKYPVIMPDGYTYDKENVMPSWGGTSETFKSPVTGYEYFLIHSGYPVVNRSVVDYLKKNKYQVSKEIKDTLYPETNDTYFEPDNVIAPLLYASNLHIMFYVHMANANPYIITVFVFWAVLFILFSLMYICMSSCWRNTKPALFFFKFGVYAMATWFMYSMFMIQYYSVDNDKRMASAFNAFNAAVLVYAYRNFNNSVITLKQT